MTTTEITVEMLSKIRAKDHITLTAIYKEGYPMIEKYILTNSGTKTDAQDIFQDAMYIFIKKCELPDFTLTSKVSTFLFGIGKNLWLKQLAKVQSIEREVSETDLQETAEFELEPEETEQLTRVKLMKRCLDALGEPCRTILEQFYFLKTPMKRIAEMLHYTNANNAKNQKYKCFMRLKKMVLADSEINV